MLVQLFMKSTMLIGALKWVEITPPSLYNGPASHVKSWIKRLKPTTPRVEGKRTYSYGEKLPTETYCLIGACKKGSPIEN